MSLWVNNVKMMTLMILNGHDLSHDEKDDLHRHHRHLDHRHVGLEGDNGDDGDGKDDSNVMTIIDVASGV